MTYLLNLFGQIFDTEQTDCDKFLGIVLLSNADFLELMFCSVSSCFNSGFLLSCLFLLDIHWCHDSWFLLDVVGNKRFLSLHCMHGGSWKCGTVHWRLPFSTQIIWILALCELLIYIYRKDNLLSCSFLHCELYRWLEWVYMIQCLNIFLMKPDNECIISVSKAHWWLQWCRS